MTARLPLLSPFLQIQLLKLSHLTLEIDQNVSSKLDLIVPSFAKETNDKHLPGSKDLEKYPQCTVSLLRLI